MAALASSQPLCPVVSTLTNYTTVLQGALLMCSCAQANQDLLQQGAHLQLPLTPPTCSFEVTTKYAFEPNDSIQCNGDGTKGQFLVHFNSSSLSISYFPCHFFPSVLQPSFSSFDRQRSIQESKRHDGDLLV